MGINDVISNICVYHEIMCGINVMGISVIGTVGRLRLAGSAQRQSVTSTNTQFKLHKQQRAVSHSLC